MTQADVRAPQTRVSHRLVHIALTQPFVSGRGTTTHIQQTVLRLDWNHLSGYGAVLGASSAELDACAALLTDAGPYNAREVLDRLRATGMRPAVAAAVDLALHDLLGKAAGVPLQHVLGLAGQPVGPTGLSLSAGSAEELVAEARRLQDWPILKLKLTPRDDGSRAGLLRSVYGGRVWVDGNGSWEPRRALQVAYELAKHDVELFEQPVAPGDLDGLAYVHRLSPVRIVADEDCALPSDVLRLREVVSAVNIKLNQCGGLQAALEMITVARHAGLAVMLGCKTESALGVTAMAQLAPLAKWLDLDGHLDLADDPFCGLTIHQGQLSLPTAPGLGARPARALETLWGE